MRVVIIGGTGHVGTYLVPRLVLRDYQVICVTRGKSSPYSKNRAWDRVEMVEMDREDEEKSGTFGQKIVDLRPDVLIDMICYNKESAKHLLEAVRGRVQQLLVCGTIWIHGPSRTVPTRENENIRPFGEYGIGKAEMHEYLLREAATSGAPITILHPGHIVGPGWNPVNPLGNFNPKVFESIIKGEEICFPTLGLETVHHVHADDVAQAFERAIDNRAHALGEDFHIVSESAITLRGYVQTVASWFGTQKRMKFSVAEDWKKGLTDWDIEMTWDHILHSPCCSIAKAKRDLDYTPRYTSMQAVYEALLWLIEHDIVSV